jgi:flagellar motor switch protein FliN
MTDAQVDVRALVNDAFCQAALTVVSQMQGQDWTISTSPTSNERKTRIGVQLDGAASTSFSLDVPYSSVLRIVELFLGAAPEISSNETLTDEYIEVLHEFVRQVMGLTVSQLRPHFGALSPSLVEPKDALSEAMNSQLSCGTASIAFQLQIGPEAVEVLTAEWAKSHAETRTAPAMEPTNDTAREPAAPEQQPESQALIASTSPVAKYLQERNFHLLLDVELQVTLRFGRREMLLKDILELSSGSVVELDRLIQEPVDLLLDHKVIARGDVVIVDGNYGVRIMEVATPQQRIECLC